MLGIPLLVKLISNAITYMIVICNHNVYNILTSYLHCFWSRLKEFKSCLDQIRVLIWRIQVQLSRFLEVAKLSLIREFRYKGFNLICT
jgi:hypothetical protein